MELTKERLILVTAGAVAVVAAGLYIFLYKPLIGELRTARLEYSAIEPELVIARQATGALKKLSKEKYLIAEEDVSFAIDELTRRGNSKGINFVSMRPQKISEWRESPYRILPIRMEIESTYEQLGIFFGLLDDLKKSLVTINEFDIIPDKKDPARLRTALIIHMYLTGR